MMTDQLPQAAIRPSSQVTVRRWRTRLWWLTGLCALLALGVSLNSLRAPGEKIVVHFREGYGIKPGDTLRYRGIDIGTVKIVHLASDLQGIDVHLELMPEHRSIAVEGSRFWIERPRLRLGQVSGLETVIGAKFVGTVPGDPKGKRQTEFEGQENPLGMSERDSIDLRVRFPAGEGLTAGDPVRYLGIDVGEVTYVELSDQLESVSVGIRLVGTAQQLARNGSQFWIERPRLDISEVRGLDTLVSGRYIAIEPALGKTEPATEFVGLSEAPPLTRREGSLDLELEARQRYGLVRGAPITYRGLEVGRVADVSLAADGASVAVQVIIEPEYVDLVRKNSVWWSTGGIKMDASLSGVNLSIDSFTSWLRGGVAFATPDPPGEKVATGYRFGLAEKADSDWLAWEPHIATGPWSAQANNQQRLPRVVRIAASWQASFLGFNRRRSVQAWCLPLEGNTAWVPASLLQSAVESKTPFNLEIGGRSEPFSPPEGQWESGLATVTIPEGLSLPLWPREKIARERWNGKSALIVVNPELSEPLPLNASRAAINAAGTLEINQAVPLHKSLEGSAVIDTASGELLGLLISLNSRWVVAAGKY